MIEFDRSAERCWYAVSVCSLAKFVVRSYTEDGAKQKIDYYLEINKQIDINSLGMYPHALVAKPLEPLDIDYYDVIGDEITPVRLVNDYRKLPLTNYDETKKPTQVDGQQILFDMSIYGKITYSQNVD
jgi:hypothetical protein